MHRQEHIRRGALNGERRRARRWLPFASGLSVGLVSGLVGVGLAVAWERARREQRRRGGLAAASAEGAAECHAPIRHPPTRTAADLEQRELDEELSQTFPASDPLPHSHQVD
jgi:hypothetical protein